MNFVERIYFIMMRMMQCVVCRVMYGIVKTAMPLTVRIVVNDPTHQERLWLMKSQNPMTHFCERNGVEIIMPENILDSYENKKGIKRRIFNHFLKSSIIKTRHDFCIKIIAVLS